MGVVHAAEKALLCLQQQQLRGEQYVATAFPSTYLHHCSPGVFAGFHLCYFQYASLLEF